MAEVVSSKICTKCRKNKILSMFHTDKRRLDGRTSECKDCHAKRGREKVREDRFRVFSHYGAMCKCCGEDEVAFLTIDHINGGGNKHRKEEKLYGSGKMYTWLIKHDFPNDFQVLCYNCNCAKQYNPGGCPHNA